MIVFIAKCQNFRLGPLLAISVSPGSEHRIPQTQRLTRSRLSLPTICISPCQRECAPLHFQYLSLPRLIEQIVHSTIRVQVASELPKKGNFLVISLLACFMSPRTGTHPSKQGLGVPGPGHSTHQQGCLFPGKAHRTGQLAVGV